jgi:transposase
MEVIEEAKRIIGIDLSKRTYVACIRDFENQAVRMINGKLTPTGQKQLIARLHDEDLVVMEAGTGTFKLARMILSRGSVEVAVLNPAKLRIIYDSLCKTDREDARKLAHLASNFSLEDLPTVSIPTEEEQAKRELVSLRNYCTKTRVQHINKLHALFMASGHPEVKRSQVRLAENRKKTVEKHLTGEALTNAQVILDLLEAVEKQLEQLDQRFDSFLEQNKGKSRLLLSITGVGTITAATIIAFVGDINRFSSARQLCNYAGLVPKFDCSGMRNVTKGISHLGNPHIRRVMVQAAWSIVTKGPDCPMKAKYERLIRTKPKQVAVVAIARDLLRTIYAVLKNEESYRYIQEKDFLEKLRRLHLREKLTA